MRNWLVSLGGAVILILPVASLAQDSDEPQEAAGIIESIYTDLGLDDGCVAYSTYEQGGSFSCPGYAGYGVLFSEGDLRQSVFYGYVGNWFAEGAFESFGNFNNVSGKIEWRVKDKVPYATIMRWFISGEDAEAGEADQGQVLVISRVAQPENGEGCVVGYVDALENENANEMAREIADTLAADFPCRIEEPVFHGEEGVAAGFPMRTFGP